MADVKEKKASENKEAVKIKESAQLDNPTEVLNENIETLIEYGGFDLLEASIDGVKVMSPEGKARKNIFLNEATRKKDREDLKHQLELWYKLLNESDDISVLIEKSQERSEQAGKLLNSNLKKAIDDSKELEQNYRSMALFFKNTEQDKVRNITIFNTDIERLKDLDNTTVIDKISEELKSPT